MAPAIVSAYTKRSSKEDDVGVATMIVPNGKTNRFYDPEEVVVRSGKNVGSRHNDLVRVSLAC